MKICKRIGAISIALVGAAAAAVGADTQAFLGAPLTKSLIRFRLSSGETKVFFWDIPEIRKVPQSLTKDDFFLTGDVVAIGYWHLNPLRFKVSASSKRVQDPTAVDMSNLVRTYLNMVNVVAPGSSGLADALKTVSAATMPARKPTAAGAPPPPCDNFDNQLNLLKDNLDSQAFAPKTVGSAVSDWAQRIDDAFEIDKNSGPAALGKGMAAIDLSKTGWNDAINKASNALDQVKACANSQAPFPAATPFSAEPGQEPEKSDPSSYPETPKEGATQAERDKFMKSAAEYGAVLKRHEEWQSKRNARDVYLQYLDDQSRAERRLIAISVVLGNAPQRIAQMRAVVATADDIKKQLSELRQGDAWTIDGNNANATAAADYIMLRTVKPSFEEMEEVTISATPLTYPVAETGIFSVKESKAITATFDVRRYSKFAVEPAVGAVFGTVRQPKYGTTVVNGKTVISRVDDSTLSVNPSLMTNFVCRCGVSRLQPMIQLGASASKDVPAALVGFGLRLFGAPKRGLGIGGGAMFAWVKDLTKLKVGQEVAGTADIEADRGYRLRPNTGGYFTIQYQF